MHKKKLLNIFDIKKIKLMKKQAVIDMRYEDAALIRDREIFLESDDGLIAIENHFAKVKRDLRNKKMKNLIMREDDVINWFKYKVYISTEVNKRIDDLIKIYKWDLIKHDAIYLMSINIFTIGEEEFNDYLQKFNEIIDYYIVSIEYISESALLRKRKINKLLNV